MRRNERGISFIEFILILVLLATSMPPLLLAFGRIQEKNVQLMPASVAAQLATKKMEELVKGTDFAAAIDQAPTAFATPFQQYRHEVIVDYVNQNDLNTSVDPLVTAFKRVEVRVTHSQIPTLSVRLVTLVTNL